MKFIGYIATALVAGVVVGANSSGDVKRYVRMRKM